MAILDEVGALHETLRRLAVVDPKRARAQVSLLLDERSLLFDEVLRRVAAPGEGRLRQLIANSSRLRQDRTALVPHFEAWLRDETDEFARVAVTAALEGLEPVRARVAGTQPLVDGKLVVAYRYAVSRLQHRLRNDLLDPMAHLGRLREQVRSLRDPAEQVALQASLRELSDTLERFSQTVEFDTCDAYFVRRSVSLPDWLQIFSAEYTRRYKRVTTRLNIPREEIRILANSYLLDIIFWNLWINAQQAVDGECEIAVHVTLVRRQVCILLIDNGPGLSEGLSDRAFFDSRVRSPAHRGRGLLEVHDAVDQLHGTCTLIPHETGGLRIALSFPLESS